MLKKIKLALIILLTLILFLLIFRNSLCQLLLERFTAQTTGFKLSIEKINLDLLRSSVLIRNLELFNPPGFKQKTLAKAEQIFIQYHPLALLSGKIHLRLVKLDISEINIIRNEQGQSNVARFKQKKTAPKASRQAIAPTAQPEEKAAQRTKPEKIKPQRPKFLIDRLELAPTQATFINYAAGKAEPALIIFSVKGPSVFTDVSDLRNVVNSVSAKGGFKAILDNLVGVLPQDIFKTSSEALKKKIGEILPNREPSN